MTATYRQTVEKIHCVSKEMLKHSQAEDWENVVSLEEERQPLLDQLGQIRIQEFDPVLEALLQKIIVINSDIEMLSRQELEECRQGCADIINKKSAISAYSAF